MSLTLSKKLTAGEIAAAVRGQLIGGDSTLPVENIFTDSRKTGKNPLYVPIVGERLDGHDFIEGAVENGAVLVLSHKEIMKGISAYILVEDTRRALMDLATYYRGMFPIPAIAVTGSVGKTSVKNAVAAVLSQRYNVLKTQGNYNNEIGLPLTVFQLDATHEAAVFEMGMNSFGEISNLSKIVRPDIGIITNIGTAHIERLGSREGILQAKLELLEGMPQEGKLILNHDNDMLAEAGENVKKDVLWISTKDEAGVHLVSLQQNEDNSFTAEIRYGDRQLSVQLAAGETPLVQNALMAAAAGFLLGLTNEEIRLGIETPIEEKGRLSISKTPEGVTVIDDCYNANADSMKLGLDILKKNKGYRAAILGDMFELGELAESFHREVGEYAAKAGIDRLIAIGKDAKYYQLAFDAAKTENQKCSHYERKEDFFADHPTFAQDTTVLVKASRGMELEEVVNFILG